VAKAPILVLSLAEMSDGLTLTGPSIWIAWTTLSPTRGADAASGEGRCGRAADAGPETVVDEGAGDTALAGIAGVAVIVVEEADPAAGCGAGAAAAAAPDAQTQRAHGRIWMRRLTCARTPYLAGKPLMMYSTTDATWASVRGPP
jgi:hypothetical protein